MNIINFDSFSKSYITQFNLPFTDFEILKVIHLSWLKSNLNENTKRRKNLYTILKKLNLDENTTVLLAGCGWGWLSENIYLVRKSDNIADETKRIYLNNLEYLISCL